MITSPAGAAATFTSGVSAFARAFAEATDDALKAAGERYQTAVTERLRAGYKTGTFVTGKAAGSVKVSEPVTLRDARVVHVYSRDFRLRLWEFGHINRWTRQFERAPVWRETAIAQAQDIAAAALASYGDMKRHWNPQWKPGQGRSHLRRRNTR